MRFYSLLDGLPVHFRITPVADSGPPQIFKKSVRLLRSDISIDSGSEISSVMKLFNFFFKYWSNVVVITRKDFQWPAFTLVEINTFTGKSADVFFPLATHRQQTQIVRTSSRYKTAAIVRPFNACLYASSTLCYLGQHSPKITDALRCSVARH